MRRRPLLLLLAASPLAWAASRFSRGPSRRVPSRAEMAADAERVNDLAARAKTLADARQLVDAVAVIFADEIPAEWRRGAWRRRIAEAEFAAVSDLRQLIPEQRLADAWNRYMDRVQAPDEQKVTAAEIHDLRDAFYSTSVVTWSQGSRNIWCVPSIYAVQPDGSLAAGCRAVEAIRVLWDLAYMRDNLTAARNRMQQGVRVSDEWLRPSRPTEAAGFVSFRITSNPVQGAMWRYVQNHGGRGLRDAVSDLLEQTLFASS